MADDPTVAGLGGGRAAGPALVRLVSYAWLGNQAQADEGLLRLAMIAAMGALFVVALAIPESYDDQPGGLFAPFVLAACYATVRIAHLVVYLVAAGDDRGLGASCSSRRPTRWPCCCSSPAVRPARRGSRCCGCSPSSWTTSACRSADPGLAGLQPGALRRTARAHHHRRPRRVGRRRRRRGRNGAGHRCRGARRAARPRRLGRAVVGLLRRGRAGGRAGPPGWTASRAAGWPATRSPTCTSRCWSASSTWRSA